MTRKLNNADRDAVDLMFDRLSATRDNDGFVATADGVDNRRIQSVEQILNVLEQMPAVDPPADLAVRTLQHIARSSGLSPVAPAVTYIDPTQPMA